MPVVGNHEYYANEELSRYLDMTWQKWKLPSGPDDHVQAATAAAQVAV